MGIKCCNHTFRGETLWALKDTDTHKYRLLEFGLCPRCLTLVACLHQKTIDTNIDDDFKPKKRKTKDFIRQCESDKVFDFYRAEYGSKQNINWKYNSHGIKKDLNGKSYGSVKTELIIHA